MPPGLAAKLNASVSPNVRGAHILPSLCWRARKTTAMPEGSPSVFSASLCRTVADHSSCLVSCLPFAISSEPAPAPPSVDPSTRTDLSLLP